MKRFSRFAAYCAVLLTLACTGSGTYSETDFSVVAYTPEHAAGFDIRTTPRGEASLVTVRNPWQGATAVTQRLLILRDGAKAPDRFDGAVVKAPVQRVVCMSSSHVALFDAIGQVRRIKGVSGIDYISNPCIRENGRRGAVRDVGYDTNIDFELLASLRPDIVLLYGVTGENTAVSGKLRELGIPYIYVGDYMEESPLGKAEWLMLAAELCGLREAGADTLRGVAARYAALKERIDTTAPRPRVMLNTPYRDTWFMPSTRSYMIRLVEDAGGEYVYPKNSGNTSVAVDLEEAYLLANSADVWINVGSCNRLDELTSQYPKFASVPAVKHRRVWNNDRRRTPEGGSDFWESGVVRPDRVLEDLLVVMRDGCDSTCYYRRLE